MNNVQITTISGLVVAALSLALAGYLTIKGMPIPDWLALVIGGGGGGSLVGVGHTIGYNAATNQQQIPAKNQEGS